MHAFVFRRTRCARVRWLQRGCQAGVLALALGAAQAQAYDLVFSNGFDPVADAPASDADAARFLTMATFGPTPASIAQLRAIGYTQWIEQQLSMPTTPQRPYVQALDAGVENPGQNDRMEAWFANAVTAPDQLRQRLAWALSQIMVVSDQLGGLYEDPVALAEYYDLLARDGAGWYDDAGSYHAGYQNLLLDVSHSPAMGRMLTFIRNDPPNPTTGYSPDENYAREVMQLFSIGLIERNLDFSPQLDGGGQPVPTYTQATVSATARVLTGLSYASGWYTQPSNGTHWADADFLPLVCYEHYHDEGRKVVLDGQVVAGGANSCEPDLDDLVAVIAHHRNVAPFVSRQLIQRFVTSNPTPDYIQRVAGVFLDDGNGHYGDLGAVVSAILTDPEATSGAIPSQYQSRGYVFGKPREPLLKLTALWRYYGAAAQNHLYAFPNPQPAYGQRPLGAPSVFNFYLPDYLPPGELGDAGQYAPEFQVINESTAVASANDLAARAGAYVGNPANSAGTIAIDLSALVALAGDPAALVDQLDHDLTYGHMSSRSKTILVGLVAALPASDSPGRVTAALQVLLASPEFAIQK